MNDYACALLVRDGRILLAKRAAHRRLYPGLWDVLGGHVEDGESLSQALSRELWEEAGIAPLSFRFMATLHDRAAHLTGVLNYHMYLVSRWSGGEPQIRNDEHTQFSWFLIDEATRLPDLALDSYRDLFRGLSQAATN